MNRPRQQATTLIAIALTFGSGAMDVASFTRLGNVFASVMTGNIVLCGLAIAHASASLIAHTATAFAGYVAGVAGGTRIAWHHATGSGTEPGPARGEGAWAPHVRATLIAELALLLGFLTGWETVGSDPTGGAQYWLLAIATAAMGMQASSVINMGLTDVSTTYLTGTLTGLVRSLASPRRDQRGRRKREGLIRPGVLAGLLAGALLSGLLVKTAPAGVPALPVAALVIVVLQSATPPRCLSGGYKPTPRTPRPATLPAAVSPGREALRASAARRPRGSLALAAGPAGGSWWLSNRVLN